MYKFKQFRFVIISLLFLTSLLYSAPQDSSSGELESVVRATARVNQKKVALNDSLIFTVRIEWTGDLGRYQISELEDPIINNLEIVATSSADYRMDQQGQVTAAKTFEFVLNPRTMGMAYIEGVIVKYIDNTTGEGHHLMTNRIDVEVLEPIPKSGESRLLLYLAVISVAVIAVLFAALHWIKRRLALKRQQAEAVPIVSLEQEYLSQLKQVVDPDDPNREVSETFFAISKIFRKYLARNYDFAALEQTTEEIIQKLKSFDLDEELITNASEILHVCDVAKFGGSEGYQDQLDRIYSLVEMIFEYNLAKNGESHPEIKSSSS
ncbi:MAG: BatD family protein [bacterium]|nr:BatD family protein [bacterium]